MLHFNFNVLPNIFFPKHADIFINTHTDGCSCFSSMRYLGEDQTVLLANGSENYGSTAAALALLQHTDTQVVCVCVCVSPHTFVYKD